MACFACFEIWTVVSCFLAFFLFRQLDSLFQILRQWFFWFADFRFFQTENLLKCKHFFPWLNHKIVSKFLLFIGRLLLLLWLFQFIFGNIRPFESKEHVEVHITFKIRPICLLKFHTFGSFDWNFRNLRRMRRRILNNTFHFLTNFHFFLVEFYLFHIMIEVDIFIDSPPVDIMNYGQHGNKTCTCD